MTEPLTLFRNRTATLSTPTDLGNEAARDIPAAFRGLLADVFALYLKTKNFHWHISGPQFRDYHLALCEHGSEIFAMTDPIAERAQAGRSCAAVDWANRPRAADCRQRRRVRHLRDMLAELRKDNQQLVAIMRKVHSTCASYGDVATTSLLEVWIDEAERRIWFPAEMTRGHDEPIKCPTAGP